MGIFSFLVWNRSFWFWYLIFICAYAQVTDNWFATIACKYKKVRNGDRFCNSSPLKYSAITISICLVDYVSPRMRMNIVENSNTCATRTSAAHMKKDLPSGKYWPCRHRGDHNRCPKNVYCGRKTTTIAVLWNIEKTRYYFCLHWGIIVIFVRFSFNIIKLIL